MATNACRPARLCCGPFTAGEVPAPLTYRFLDADGAPLPLDGFQAVFCWAERFDPAAAGQQPAQVTDPDQGEVTYTWSGAELASPGRYTGQLWAWDASNRYASVPISFDSYAAVCAAPAA
jgi:hypothetical protein